MFCIDLGDLRLFRIQSMRISRISTSGEVVHKMFKASGATKETSA